MQSYPLHPRPFPSDPYGRQAAERAEWLFVLRVFALMAAEFWLLGELRPIIALLVEPLPSFWTLLRMFGVPGVLLAWGVSEPGSV